MRSFELGTPYTVYAVSFCYQTPDAAKFFHGVFMVECSGVTPLTDDEVKARARPMAKEAIAKNLSENPAIKASYPESSWIETSVAISGVVVGAPK